MIKKYKSIIEENYKNGAFHPFSDTAVEIPKNDEQLNGCFAGILRDLQNGAEADKAQERLYKLQKFYNTKTKPYGNWWFWEMGIPRSLNAIFALIYDSVDKELMNEYLEAERHFNNKIKLTGANRLWEAEIFAIRGILCGNKEEISAAKSGIEDLFKMTQSGDGFYEDGSYIQHENIPYNGGYGLSLLSGLSDIKLLFDGTEYEFKNTEIIDKWIKNSFLPFMYKGRFMDMVRGREISRCYSSAEFAYKKAEYAISRFGDYEEFTGFKYFKNMDRAVVRRADWSAGLSMHSKRIANYESINNENFTSWHMSDGALWLYTEPERFDNAYLPCVDMERLPGTTVLRGERIKPNKTSEYGYCIGNDDGICAMYLAPYNSKVKAKKAWFFIDEFIVCMGAEISCGETVIENIMLKENHEICCDGDFICIKERDDNTGLCVYSCNEVKTVNEVRRGSWLSLNINGDGLEYEARFFTMYTEDKGKYMYILFPKSDINEAKTTVKELIWENNGNEQFVIYGHKKYSVNWNDKKCAVCDAGVLR